MQFLTRITVSLLVASAIDASPAAAQQNPLCQGCDSTRREATLMATRAEIDGMSRSLALLRDKLDDTKSEAGRRELELEILRLEARRDMARRRLTSLQNATQFADELEARDRVSGRVRRGQAATSRPTTVQVYPTMRRPQ